MGLGILANFVGAVGRPDRLMDLYPAIDIRDGRRGPPDPGRLRPPEPATGTRWTWPAASPRPARPGCTWSTSTPPARAARSTGATVLAIAAAVDVPVQTGGGVRTEADVAELLDGGVARVVLGTAALDDPGLVAALAAAAYPGRVAVGRRLPADADGRTEVAVRGWEQGSGRTVADLLDELAGAGAGRRGRHGHRAGRHADRTRPRGTGRGAGRHRRPGHRLGWRGRGGRRRRPGRSRSRCRTRRRQRRRLAGAITGKALVDGRMTVEEGVAACAPSG